jgi:hypothetical protein
LHPSGAATSQSWTQVLVAWEQTKPQAHGQGEPSWTSSIGGNSETGTQLVVPSSLTTVHALSEGQLHPFVHG